MQVSSCTTSGESVHSSQPTRPSSSSKQWSCYCNSLLAGLPASAIRPLQLIQNAAARLIFNAPKYTHTTRLLTDLHWLPVIARIKFKTLVLAYQRQSRDQPPLTSNNSSDPTHRPDLYAPLPLDVWHPPARHTCTARSRLLSVLAPQWWNDLLVDVRTAETLSTFKRRLKNPPLQTASLPPSLISS